MTLQEKLLVIKRAIEEKKGRDIKIYDLREFSTICDCFVICTSDLPLQSRAIADEIDKAMSEKGVYPLSVEGYEDSEWVLIDYGDVIVHIFTEAARLYYDLDRLWADAPEVILNAEE